jgi:hypothetical protein
VLSLAKRQVFPKCKMPERVGIFSLWNAHHHFLFLFTPSADHWEFIGLAYQKGKDSVFKFILKYSSLRDFYRPLHNNTSIFLYEDFWKIIFWLLVLKLGISYTVLISWRILVSFRGFFLKINNRFAWWNIWVLIILLWP